MTVGANALDFGRVVVRHGEKATPVEKRVAALLGERLSEPSGLAALVESESAPSQAEVDTLIVLLGIPGHHSQIAERFDKLRIKPLSDLDPGLEGFYLKLAPDEKSPTLIAAGLDERGTLYAVGEILRRMEIGPERFTLSDTLAIRSAPAFEIRGTQYGQSGVAREKGKVRPWTEEELQRMILDYALAGANVFSTEPGPVFEFLKSYGLMTQEGFGANTGSGPPEWTAKESIGRTGYLCLSVPEARQAQIDRCEAQFKNHPAFDLVKFHGGDGGGCECDLCEPYGLTFIETVEEMANRIHKHHPTTRVYITNQKFDNADDNAIFRYLQEKPREWLWAFGYGPGSDAMSWQPGHRQTHRMDLFRYPGFGPYGRYPQEILHELPPQHKLVYYNEITHWRYAQHAYIQMYPRADRLGDLPPPWNHWIYERRPDPALTMVYDRLTFYAWPRYYHWVFNQLMRYSVGDITHSSGHHDHFNQWMWQRLLWAPHTSVEDVVDEYCVTWFGKEAAPEMAQALFQLEENLEENREKPITEKEGIDRYYDLAAAAGKKMPAHLMAKNWLWREYMQKGALDKHIKQAVGRQVDLQDRVENRIATALEEGEVDAAIDEALPWFEQLEETEEMRNIREEAGRLGEESNALYGVRSEGYFNLDHDFIGLGWSKRQLELAREAKGEEKRELLWMTAHYEDPGEGGYYDNCGTFEDSPNLVRGYPYDHGQPYVPGMLFETNHPSQRSMVFTQDEPEGVAFEYRDLDPNAEYVARLTLMRPWYQERYRMRMNQTSQSILADDQVLADHLEIPQQKSEFFTFDIPKEAVQDGELLLHFKKAPDVANGSRVEREMWRNSGGWGTLVSEVWLMRKDKLPWR
jgi:hypothetical protein